MFSGFNTPQSAWSKITLITSSVGGAGEDPPSCKTNIFFLRSLALSVPIYRNFQEGGSTHVPPTQIRAVLLQSHTDCGQFYSKQNRLHKCLDIPKDNFHFIKARVILRYTYCYWLSNPNNPRCLRKKRPFIIPILLYNVYYLQLSYICI